MTAHACSQQLAIGGELHIVCISRLICKRGDYRTRSAVHKSNSTVVCADQQLTIW